MRRPGRRKRREGEDGGRRKNDTSDERLATQTLSSEKEERNERERKGVCFCACFCSPKKKDSFVTNVHLTSLRIISS